MSEPDQLKQVWLPDKQMWLFFTGAPTTKNRGDEEEVAAMTKVSGMVLPLAFFRALPGIMRGTNKQKIFYKSSQNSFKSLI